MFAPEKPAPPKKTTYNSLNVHQRINLKANMCGFQSNVFHLHWVREQKQVRENFDRLTFRWYWHHYVNGGRNHGKTPPMQGVRNKNRTKRYPGAFG